MQQKEAARVIENKVREFFASCKSNDFSRGKTLLEEIQSRRNTFLQYYSDTDVSIDVNMTKLNHFYTTSKNTFENITRRKKMMTIAPTGNRPIKK